MNICRDERFDKFIMIVILLNTVALSMIWNNIDSRILEISEEVLQYANIVFIAEAAIKIIA